MLPSPAQGSEFFLPLSLRPLFPLPSSLSIPGRLPQKLVPCLTSFFAFYSCIQPLTCNKDTQSKHLISIQNRHLTDIRHSSSRQVGEKRAAPPCSKIAPANFSFADHINQLGNSVPKTTRWIPYRVFPIHVSTVSDLRPLAATTWSTLITLISAVPVQSSWYQQKTAESGPFNRR